MKKSKPPKPRDEEGCNTVVKQVNGLATVTCETHPEFKVPMRQGVSTEAVSEIARFHLEGYDRD